MYIYKLWNGSDCIIEIFFGQQVLNKGHFFQLRPFASSYGTVLFSLSALWYHQVLFEYTSIMTWEYIKA